MYIPTYVNEPIIVIMVQSSDSTNFLKGNEGDSYGIIN